MESGSSRAARYDEGMNQPGTAGAAQEGASPRRGEARVAFFGGSFDPPHLGHLAVARAARAAFALDAVLFAPVGMQPLKPEGPAANFEDRVAMTRLAIVGEPGFQVSLADAPQPASNPADAHTSAAGTAPKFTPNYTIDTLERLRTTLAPDCSLFCLMGADSFFGLPRWHRAAELPFMAPLIVASRPGQPLQDLEAALPTGLSLASEKAGIQNEAGVEVRTFVLVNSAGDRTPFYVLPGLDVQISASEIRAQIHAPSSSPSAGGDLVPKAVRAYIAQHGLYRS
jgi:nicotinate-nucleotide adenylyltransferase